MKELRQSINECYIPTYMQDILTNNYCPNFLRMSMLREEDNYTFNYQTGRYVKLNVARLSTKQKLQLLKNMILIKEKNEDRLIAAESYLVEPELIYTIDNNISTDTMRLLFYPDFKKMDFTHKIVHFADKITNFKDEEEIKIINKFKISAESEEWSRTKILLDKNIHLIETSSQLVV